MFHRRFGSLARERAKTLEIIMVSRVLFCGDSHGIGGGDPYRNPERIGAETGGDLRVRGWAGIPAEFAGDGVMVGRLRQRMACFSSRID
jgi:hypothetical protein